tara:strand:- start:23178 stop:24665 length:1488 start_codon:yes stop_codon:yes gene_type:complete
MPLEHKALPIICPLPDDTRLDGVFRRLCHLPGCLWLDSAAGGRFSFITADPIDTLVAMPGDPNPWPRLADWNRRLPRIPCQDELPPFQGGIAGLIGYEAGMWLEPVVGMAPSNDLPTPAMSLGLYDWTIAMDHRHGRALLICNGLGDKKSPNQKSPDQESAGKSAHQRAEQIQDILHSHSPLALEHSLPWMTPRTRSGSPSSGGDILAGQIPKLVGQHATKHAGVFSNFTGAGFRAGVAEIVQRIHAGDSFQVNLAQRLTRQADLPSPELYMRLRQSNPAPFGAYYGGEGFEVLSSSPEGFLSVRDGLVETRPIKGTAPRVGDARPDALLAHKLRVSEKDRAENVMIVDLMRNDLSRVCEDDSVVVEKLCQIETYQYVQHLVSVVQGQLRADRTVVDLLAACFPGGSVTGAPKIEAMRTIAELEPNPRGPYCGSIGYISTSGDADFNILIRTITASHGHWQIPVGGGITARSTPAAEEAETWSKAEGMLRAFRAK